MKQILTIVMLLTSLASYAQDTTVVMVTLNEILTFKWGEPDTVLTRFKHRGEVNFEVQPDTVICLHFSDEKKRFRDVTTTFENGDHVHNTFNSEDNVVFSQEDWGNVTIHISEARRKK